ncbi:MAG: MBL fold metallo-hydrolase, partial [Nanoarchaeota archaeon]
LETNNDIDMVLNGRYPYHLKQRILGDMGHLSNVDAGLLVKENASEKLKTVFLAHISQNNNTYDLALDTFTKLTNNMKINRILTNQKEMTNIIQL